MSEKKKTGKGSGVVAKAGIWYTVCNFAFKAMAFITTPIFSRLMSKNELGSFSNFSSWIAILMVVTSFDLAQSIIRSRLEHEDDMDSYIWSILSFSTLWTLLVYGVFLLFQDFCSSLLKIDVNYIHIMFLYLFTAPAYTMLITKHRAEYRYKTFVLLTGVMTISGTVLSVVLVMVMQNKLAGRIIGYYIPYILIGFAIYTLLAYRGKRIKVAYWKYACVICLPLVPHVLSLYLLSSSDTLIITRLCGAEYTAVYSIAYSAYHVVTVLFDSMNKAWAPWLLESLHHNRYEAIRKNSKIYVAIFVVLIVGVLLFVPEIILILGGRQYNSAIYCLPPLVTGCVFQFIYTMYVNIEFYKKKTIGVSIATMIATGANIVLNLIFIPMDPEHSYVIAAYTTLAGYILLFILHYAIVKHMKMAFVYDTKLFIGALLFVLSVSGLMNVLYGITIVRYGLIICYGLAVLVGLYKFKTQIMSLLKSKS